MHFEKGKKRKDGSYTLYAADRYVDPLTGKHRQLRIKVNGNNARSRKQAQLDLAAKIEELIAERQGTYAPTKLQTFGELKTSWFDSWQVTVRPQTVHREMTILMRVEELLADDILLSVITPLLIQNVINDYRQKYHSTHSTMQHVKCTLNKIFDYGILHNVIEYSPSRVVKLIATVDEKHAKRERREAKFLNQQEVRALLCEVKKRRNPNYYDLTLFMLATGSRIGEVSALTENDIDFETGFMTIDKSLQYHDLRVDEYYTDDTKTDAADRVEQLPQFAIDAVKRCLARNRVLDARMAKCPSKMYRHSDAIFRTEHGTPITSHSYREILGRINDKLRAHCQECYGFKWTKNAIPHGFRHVHISVLQNDPTVPAKEVQTRVGHVLASTTAGYTHSMSKDQTESVESITHFMDAVLNPST